VPDLFQDTCQRTRTGHAPPVQQPQQQKHDQEYQG
jgi:hypothetical protein